ncbi:hypothetical protein V8J36_08155 [Frigidibacter sp. MR17.14]|uniref:hypothetical protein n=1 Tax=Frigidibacter sp. MR17.14 TaxID=3126509 RepID=UPI003012ADEA
MLTLALKRFVLSEDGAMAIDWFAVTTGLLGLGAITTAAVVGTMAAGPLRDDAREKATPAAASAGMGNWRPMALDEAEVLAIHEKATGMTDEALQRMRTDLTPYARAEMTADTQVKRLADTYFLIRAELAARGLQ